MAKSSNCPECGAPLPAAAPGGFCPQCLIALGLDEPHGIDAGKTEQVGPYKILERIGEGGMGDIYLAEQLAPIRRRVALKIIKLGMDTRQVIARFESERQALALMDHPNIASVFDAGEHEGRPYFVMEYVQGVPVTEYCDRHRLSTDERLDLFSLACQAIQHAHQKGIIHRDIKPSNVLVAYQDGKAVPKVIDFGVAKATNQRLTEKTLYTHHELMIGTPEYMSPEQAEFTGLDIDTRTDIYSLGVLLYELLTGVLPFDAQTLREAGFEEVRRIIREDDPEKPTTKLEKLVNLGDTAEAIARQRHTDLKSLSRQLRGDLEWIVLKALEKDRGRRYPTPSALAADIERHRNHDPVMAGPPSRSYRLGKFVRKHRLPVFAAASIVFTALVLGGVASWFGIRAVQSEQAALAARDEADVARAEAVTEAAISREIRDFLSREILQMADPVAQLTRQETVANPEITLLEALNRSAARIGNRFANQPLILAEVRDTIGRTYAGLGQYSDARQQLEMALAIRERDQGPDNPDTLATAVQLGAALLRLQSYAEAGEHAKRVIAGLGNGPGYDNNIAPGAISLLVSVYGNSLYLDRDLEMQAATALLHDLIDELRANLGDAHATTGIAISGVVTLYLNQLRPQFAEADNFLQALLREQRRELGDDDPATIRTLVELARSHVAQQRFAEAEQILSPLVSDEAIARIQAAGSEALAENAALVSGIELLGKAYGGLGNRAQADNYSSRYQEVIATLRVDTMDSSPNATLARLNQYTRRLGEAQAGLVPLAIQGRVAEFDDEIRLLLDEYREARVPAREAWSMAMSLATMLHVSFTRAGRSAEGRQALENILQNFNDGFEPAVNETARLMVTFANLVIRTGDYVYAEELHIRAIDILAQEMGRAHPLIEPVRQDLSRIYDRHYRVLVAEGRQAEARAVAVRCTDLYTDWLEAVRALPTGNYRVSQEMIQGVRSVAYAMAALYPQAEAEFQSMVRRQELGLAVGQTDLIPQLMPAFIATVGWTQYLNGQFSEAEVTMRKALGDAEARQLTDELVYYRVLGMLGAIVAAQRRFEEAEELLQKAYQGNLQFPGQGAEAAGMVGFNIPRFLSEETHGLRLIALYESWGKADKAAEWREKVANTPPTFGAP